jgi:hypothetical protein
MCYLLSNVTGKASARGHYSAVKGATGGGGGGRYAGKWKAYTFGDVTLEQMGDQVTGRYGNTNGIQGPGSIQGVVKGDQLHFQWRSDRGQEGQAIWYPFQGAFAGKICGSGLRNCPPDGYEDVRKVGIN